MTTLLSLYEQELISLRHHAGQFAREYPKIAGRLGLHDGGIVEDPDVERLMEGFAFLAARIRLDLAEQPARLARHLLEIIHPDYLAPTPSMAVVQLKPSAATSSTLASGYRFPRGGRLRSDVVSAGSAVCEYLTAHDVVLWPLDIADARYGPAADADLLRLDARQRVRASLRVRLRTQGGVGLDALSLDALPFFIHTEHRPAVRLYEQLVARCVGIVVMPTGNERASWREVIDPSSLKPLGFEDTEALLPSGARTSQGHRLLREFFALPERFLFLELLGLRPAASRCFGTELEVIFFFDAYDDQLPAVVDSGTLRLFCTPAINLFPKHADPIIVSDFQTDHLIVPDRSQPRDYEVHSVTSVAGRGREAKSARQFLPLQAAFSSREPGAYFSIQRRPRLPSREERTQGVRSSYAGVDVFLSLVDRDRAHHGDEVQHLSVDTLCTNGDLPLFMGSGGGLTGFRLDAASEEVESVRALTLVGPTRPQQSPGADEKIWPLIRHLSLNHSSMVGIGTDEGGAALRELLLLHASPDHVISRLQINALRAVSSRPVIRRLPGVGAPVFGRGLEVSITFDDQTVDGFLLAAVLERLFGRSVSMNSFSETVLRTPARGEVMRWPPRTGTRPTL